MTDPQEVSDNTATAASSGGEPDPIRDPDTGGTDVGGPGAATESSAEDAVTGTSTVGQEDSPDDQAVNPL